MTPETEFLPYEWGWDGLRSVTGIVASGKGGVRNTGSLPFQEDYSPRLGGKRAPISFPILDQIRIYQVDFHNMEEMID